MHKTGIPSAGIPGAVGVNYSEIVKAGTMPATTKTLPVENKTPLAKALQL